MRQAVGHGRRLVRHGTQAVLNATGIESTRLTHESRIIPGDTPGNNQCMVLVGWPRVVIQLGTCQWPAPLAIASGTCVKEQGIIPVGHGVRPSHLTRRRCRGNKSDSAST